MKISKYLIMVAFGASFAFGAPNNQVGCGLGSLIWNTKDPFTLSLAATTNATSWNQTFGITSGTSGCSRGKLAQNQRVVEFVASNMDQLSRETSMGDGETLDALAELMDVKEKELFKKKLQENYNLIYVSKNVQTSEVVDNIQSL